MKRFLLKLWTTIRNFFCPKKSDMKIFNKVVWGKVAPENKNDIWFDGSNLRIYTEGSWEIILRGSGGGNIDPELLKQEVIDNEEVTAAALNDLKDKIENISSKDEANEIIAKSLNELNEKIETTEVVNVYLDTRHKFYVTDKKLFDTTNAKVIIHGANYIIFDTESITGMPLNLLIDAIYSIGTDGRISIPIVDKHYGNTQIKTYLELILYNNNSFDAYIHETKTEFGDKLTIHYTKYDATVVQTTDNALVDRVWEIE